MSEGWHCLHLYYRVDQKELNRLDEAALARGRDEFARLLNPEREGAPSGCKLRSFRVTRPIWD